MNLENIIVIGVCLTAIAITIFYFYNKYNSQKQEMLLLSKRCETIEMILTKPPPQNELSDVYNRNTSQDQDFQWIPPQRKGPLCVIIEKAETRSDVNGFRNWSEPGQGLAISDRGGQSSILIPQKCEVEGLCDLQPLRIETSEAEINEIVEDEIKAATERELSEGRSKSPPKNK